MDLMDMLVKAKEAVAAAELPAEFQVVAFERLLDALLGASESAAPKSPAGLAKKVSSGAASGKLAALADALGTSIEQVKVVYAEDDEGNLELVVPVGRLDGSKSTATKQIALLIAGARQLPRDEEWTGVRDIRRACERYGKFDSANFATTVKKMEDVFSFKGTGQKRLVRMNKVGETELRALYASLPGGVI